MLPDYTKSVRFNMCPISLIDNTWATKAKKTAYLKANSVT